MKLLVIVAGIVPIVSAFAPPSTDYDVKTNTLVRLSMGYVPDGMTPEQYKKRKDQENAANAKKKLGAFGPQSFKSRSVQSFQTDLEQGKTSHVLPVFNAKQLVKAGKIKEEDIPYMQRGGSWDNSDVRNAKKKEWNEVDKKYNANQNGTDSLEHRVLQFLHRKSFQVVLASLLMLDVIILFTELALLTLYPACYLVERDAISCCPAPAAEVEEDENLEHFIRRWLEETADTTTGSEERDHHDLCGHGLVAMDQDHYQAGCDEHKWHKVHTAETVMFAFTMAILCIFFLELCLTMWAIKPWVFFRQFFYALDFLIVTVSIVLESIFHALEDDVLATMFGLLIVGRIWRFIRIGHGIVELSHDKSHHEFEELMEYTEKLELYIRFLEQKLLATVSGNGMNTTLPDCPPQILQDLGDTTAGINVDSQK